MNKKITKRILANKAYKEILELDRNEIRIAIRELFNTLEEIFVCGNGVSFRNFGNFTNKTTRIGVVNDFQTGKKVFHKPRKIIKFKASKRLREILNR